MSGTSINIDNENLIPRSQDSEEESSPTKVGLVTILLFVLSGSPGSFTLMDSLWCELAWFDSVVPEGKTLASWFLLMQAVGSVSVLCFILIESWVVRISKICFMYCTSLSTVVICLTLSFTWHFSLDGVSVFLLLGSGIGYFTGWAQLVFVVPWIANNYNPRLISAFYSGNTSMAMCLLLLEMAQQPGGAKNFSPRVWYLVVSIAYAVAFVACVYTFNRGRGKLNTNCAVRVSQTWQSSLCTQTFTPVFCETKFLIFGQIWVMQCTWAVVATALPHAASHSTNSAENDGGNFLQWAITMGYVAQFLGAATSYCPTRNFWIPQSIFINTAATVVITMAGLNIGEWSSWGMRFFLMTAVCLGRFTCAWIVPLIVRELSRRYPDKTELMARSQSLWSLYANIIVGVPLWYFTKSARTKYKIFF